MKAILSYPKECSIYPGGYIPLPETEALRDELKISGKESSTLPLMNMDEFTDHFKVEVVVPGIKREDIIISVSDNILSIMVVGKNREELRKGLQIHEFETACLERHLLLPENADPEFVCAEYRQGVLRLHIPKTQQPSKNSNEQIVVY